ncbi:MAG: AAA family ATPase [Patescibacteria group bacterium]
MIIGIAGTIGAGKGTVVAYLQGKGFAHYSSSSLLKEILDERGLPATRLNLSTLADELSATHPGGVLHLSHAQAQKEGVTNYVLEAIHRESEAAYIRSIGGIILGVDADISTRYKRTTKRGEGEKDDVTFEEFLENAKREDEGKGATGANIRAVLREADAVVMNDGSPGELYTQVEAVLEEIARK